MRTDRAAVRAGQSPPRRLSASQYLLLGAFIVASITATGVVGPSHVAEYAGWSFVFGVLSAPIIIFGVVRWLRYRV